LLTILYSSLPRNYYSSLPLKHLSHLSYLLRSKISIVQKGPNGSKATVVAHGGVADAVGHSGGGVEVGCGFLMIADRWVLIAVVGFDGKK
jgi:hypothetical protein